MSVNVGVCVSVRLCVRESTGNNYEPTKVPLLAMRGKFILQ